MEPNPRIWSRLGCGGVLLLPLGMISVPLVGAGVVEDVRRAGLVMGKEHYSIGEIWWLVGPLGVVSFIAVFRLAFGHRDWLATATAAAWVAIAAVYTVTTGQFEFLVWTGLILFLIATGTWKDRRGMETTD
jgi:hypothetical protein